MCFPFSYSRRHFSLLFCLTQRILLSGRLDPLRDAATAEGYCVWPGVLCYSGAAGLLCQKQLRHATG